MSENITTNPSGSPRESYIPMTSYPIPVRPGVIAILKLLDDLTYNEALHLGEVQKTLPISHQPAVPKGL